MITLDKCLCCGQDDIAKLLNYGSQPLANSLRKPDDTSAIETFPLRLGICQHCGHLQLMESVPPEQMFDNYLYASGTSRTLHQHFMGLAAEARSHCELQARMPRSLDLACNDGTLIRCMQSEGFRASGVDPAINLVARCRNAGMDVWPGYWGKENPYLGELFDCITACNVLAHVPDPLAFLQMCRDSLAPGGSLWVEVPSAANLLRWRQWDTVYHEHHSYFREQQLRMLVARAGLQVESVKKVPVHGGSMRVRMTPADAALPVVMQKPLDVSMVDFPADCETVWWDLRDCINHFKDKGYAVVGYGAAAKTTVTCNASKSWPNFIVDDAPDKQGLCVPMANHDPCPIIYPTSKLQFPTCPILLVVYAWNFLPEVLDRARKARGAGHPDDKYLTYIPNVHIRPLAEDPEQMCW